ncbi:SUMF1/EgtB/PvdO family nonheme iron enzyme [Planctomycetota bacterium]
MSKPILIIACVALLCSWAQAFTIDWIIIGDPCNVADNTGQGLVNYMYRIGIYEVTNTQYADFLNAVDPNGINDLGVYNVSMGTSSHGGINFYPANAPGYKYITKIDMDEKSVNYISFYDALRFVNWLNNGQGSADTEAGSYTLSDGASVVRNPGAKFVLPTLDEWYKAAYYNGTTYYDYPCGSDDVPTGTLPGSEPNTINSDSAVGTITTVGAYMGSPSPCGTFDQGGNVWEWCETLSASDPSKRVKRGGSYVDSAGSSGAGVYEHDDPASESADLGFRVADATELTTDILYWSENFNPWDGVYRGSADGTGSVTLVYDANDYPIVPPSSEIGGLAIDNLYVYWADDKSRQILRGPKNGSGPVRVLFDSSDMLNRPVSVAVDDSYVYWADWGANHIQRGSKNGLGSATILFEPNDYISDPPEFKFLWDVVVDDSLVYWTDALADQILCGPKNGSGSAVVLFDISNYPGSPSAAAPFGLTVDDEFLYWADSATEQILRGAKSGTGPVQELFGINDYPDSSLGVAPRDVAVDEWFVYWVDQTTSQVLRGAKTGFGSVDELFNPSDNPTPTTHTSPLFIAIDTFQNIPVYTTFDTDLEGWRVTGDNSAVWEATTGNPNGCLSVNDWATGAMNYAIAPSKYHGDWSHMTASDSLSIDIFHSSSDPDDVNPNFIFRIAGPGGAAYALSGAPYFPVNGVWTHYSVSLDQNDWTIESGTWNDILSAVNSLRIWAEFTSGNETVRLDNICLSSQPHYFFIPCTYDDFNSGGTGDWSFMNTGGVSNPGSYGNKGGYLKITDASGYSIAYAPSKFLGDWSPLDSNGYVTIDLRIISRSGSDLGISEFIRISGPGGSAYINIDPADFPQSSRIWKTFQYPLNATVWTVDSGTWPSLLANVAECVINLEFYSSTEIIGLDNFSRRSNSCPPIDDTVLAQNPHVTKIGWQSLVGLSSPAYNYKDGNLYGVIRATTGSGGGIYPITGTNPGIRIQAYENPAHLIFDPNGNAFISEDYSGIIYRLKWKGASSVWVEGFHSGDDDPFGMTFAPRGYNGPNVSEGDILVTDRGSGGADQIWSFSPDTPEGEQLVMPDPGNVDQFDLAADPNGAVYVCDEFNTGNLFTLDPDGVLTALPLNTPVNNIRSIVYDSVTDDIYIAGNGAKAVYRVNPSTGDVTLVADGFANLWHCCLEIDPAGRRLWVVDYGYNRVYEFSLVGGAPVDISVTLQGAARPDPAGWQIPLHISFFAPGDDALQDMPLFRCYQSTNKSGSFAITQVLGVATGAYDIAVVSDHTLTNVKRNVIIPALGASVDMNTLAEGNANDDQQIDLFDFSIFASAFNSSQPDPNYDPRADFDRNGTVNILDLFLLAYNWLRISPINFI